MKPLNVKERKDLFFQYLVIFTFAAGAVLAALFFTQDSNNDLVDDNDKVMYSEFAGFEKTQPRLQALIDTVIAEANIIATQNDDGSFALQNANELINNFVSIQNANTASKPFIDNVTDILKLYVSTAGQKKGYEDQQIEVEKQLQKCGDNLKEKKFKDDIKNMANPGANNPGVN